MSATNPVSLSLNQRRFRNFIKQGRARFGLAILGTIFLFTFPAEIWSNQAPLIFVRDGSYFFPAVRSYSVDDFGITDSFVVDFKALLAQDQEQGKNTWAVFPINRWDPYIQSGNILGGPSSEHWLGTDNLGRDVTARLIYGVRVSLLYGLLFWMISYAIGITIGSIQGFFAGRTDFALERVKELAEIIPFLSVVILVNGLTHSQSFWVTLMVVVAFGWLGISSQVRAQFLALRKRDFCEAAIALGGGARRVIFLHILPNALTPVLTLTPFAISLGIGTLATLDFLGFGLNPPTPSLGELLAQGRNYITQAPHLLMAPTFALIMMLISINLVGESLRQAFDPRKS
jgi:microcin C transport system permease protein